MCGLAGYNSKTSNNEAKNLFVIREMMELMKSRGPDAKGEYLSNCKRTILGHRRLAILDLDKRSNQPFTSDDKRYTIIFNGEIYNYKELREKYLNQQMFSGESDTEVILKLFIAKGVACLNLLRGMFAIVIWDNYEKTLTLARDPYGIKPLYYVKNENGFSFCSQVKPLVKSMPNIKSIEPAGLVGFYLWGNIPEPWTLYKDLMSLPKGSYMKVKDGEIVESRKWCNLSDIWTEENSSTKDAQEIIAESVSGSVKSHLVSDVPVCVFLSAGIDSCTVASLASEQISDIEGITVSFEEFKSTSEDEFPLAKLAADQFNIKSLERHVTKGEFIDDVPKILDCMDQPSIDGINTWFVSKATKERGYKVALSGVGGDELFCGYPSFKQIPNIRRISSLISILPRFEKLSGLLSPALKKLFNVNKISKLSNYSDSITRLYLLKRSLFLPEEIQKIIPQDLYEEGIKKVLEDELLLFLDSDFNSTNSQISFLESNLYLCNQLLRDSDWASMSHSVELRTPLVDYKLLRNILPLQSNLKLGEGKKFLSKSPKINVPKQIVNKKKTGFSLPMDLWIGDAVQSLGLDSKNIKFGDNWARKWSQVIINKNIDL